MAYCKNCGNQLKEGASFCSECGQVIQKPNQPSQQHVPRPVTNHAPSQENNQTMPPPPRKPLSKKAKVLTTLTAFFAVILVGGYFIVGNLIGPKAVVDDFLSAIEEKDAKKVKTFLNEGHSELSVDEKQAEAFISFLHEDPERMSDLSKSLKEDIVAYKAKDTIYISDSDSSYAQLQQDGKKWLLYDRYVIQIQPVYAEIESSEDKTEIYLNDKKLGTVDSDEEKVFGPFLPGVYEIKAVVNGDFGKIEQTEEMELIDPEEPESYLSFDWSDYYIDTYSYVGDAILYVNGKNTKKNIKTFDSIGPIPMDGSVKVAIAKAGESGMKKSKEITIEEGMRRVSFDIEMKAKEEVEEEVVTEEEGAEEQEQTETASSDEKNAVKKAVQAHYGNISKNNFSSAYELFSATRKGKVSFEGWEKGLQANIRNEVTKVEVKSVDGNTAKIYMEMTSYDSQEDGTTLVQEWGGYWNLLKENGQWKLHDPDLEKLASRVE